LGSSGRLIATPGTCYPIAAIFASDFVSDVTTGGSKQRRRPW